MRRAERTGKLIVLTGCTRGLGRALASAFAGLGHTVIGCGRTASAIEELRLEPGPPHDFDVVDVGVDAAVGEWAERVISLYGAADLLLNNAAVINSSAPLWQVSAAEMERVVRVNLLGVAAVIHHFVPAMIERGSGVIVNWSSYWGRSVAPDVAPYCMTKWGIEGLTQALAQELPEGLSAVAFNPGIIDTAMLRSCFGESAGQYASPASWAATTAPYLLSLGAKHNGKSLTAPGH